MLEDGAVMSDALLMTPPATDRQGEGLCGSGPPCILQVHCEGQIVVAERRCIHVQEQVERRTQLHGLNVLQNEFYFAEGSTRNNSTDGCLRSGWFDEPDLEKAANVTMTYMLESGQNIEKSYLVAPHSAER